MSEIYKIAVLAFLVSLLAAFIILTGNKTYLRYKLRDKCDIWHMSLIAKMLDCDFCLSFWLSVLIAIALAVLSHEYYLFVLPFLSTPLARYWI